MSTKFTPAPAVSNETLCLSRSLHFVSITNLAHMELVFMDFLSLELDHRGTANISVVTDHFTHCAQAYPTKHQKTSKVAKIMWEKIFIHYGLPAGLHWDQGWDFESWLIKKLCKIMGIKKSHTTLYHPQGNLLPERFNHTLLNMQGTLELQQKYWSQNVEHLVHVYNFTRHDATGYCPIHAQARSRSLVLGRSQLDTGTQMSDHTMESAA